jgi:hypothetical protein
MAEERAKVETTDAEFRLLFEQVSNRGRWGPEDERGAEPAEHRMTMLGDVDIGSGTLRFVKDYVGVDYHNDSHSHIDALCHVAFDGALYNGRPKDSVTSAGAGVETIEVLKDGLVGRGALLDTDRRGDWVAPQPDRGSLTALSREPR